MRFHRLARSVAAARCLGFHAAVLGPGTGSLSGIAWVAISALAMSSPGEAVEATRRTEFGRRKNCSFLLPDLRLGSGGILDMDPGSKIRLPDQFQSRLLPTSY